MIGLASLNFDRFGKEPLDFFPNKTLYYVYPSSLQVSEECASFFIDEVHTVTNYPIYCLDIESYKYIQKFPCESKFLMTDLFCYEENYKDLKKFLRETQIYTLSDDTKKLIKKVWGHEAQKIASEVQLQ